MGMILQAGRISIGLISALSLQLASYPAAAGTNDFQNLGFELVSFIAIPGDSYNRVEANAALPGWAVFVATNQVDRVLHNGQFLSSAGVSVLDSLTIGSRYHSIEGNYSIFVQGGSQSVYPGLGVGFVETAVAQRGLVPPAARSLRFKATGGGFTVLLDGRNAASAPLWVGTNYAIFAADVAPYAGRVVELRFTTPWDNAFSLDSIEFSAEPAPIPPQPFSLLEPALIKGTFTFTVTSPPGTAYRVEASSNLVDWATWRTITNWAAVEIFREYLPASNYTVHFQRVATVNP